jgi:hypothetical protein
VGSSPQRNDFVRVRSRRWLVEEERAIGGLAILRLACVNAVVARALALTKTPRVNSMTSSGIASGSVLSQLQPANANAAGQGTN